MIRNFYDKIANRIRLGYLAAFLLLLLSYILTYSSTQKLTEQARWVNHTNEVIHDLDNIIASVTRCESAFRGYILTDNKKLLDEYYIYQDKADSTFKKVKGLIQAGSSQPKNLDSLQKLIGAKFEWIKKSISVLDSSKTKSNYLVNVSNEGLSTMEKLEDYIHQMQNDERNLLKARSGYVAQYSRTIKIINIASIILAVILTLYSIIIFNKENTAKLTADQQAAEFQKQLEKRFEELATLNVELIELRNIEKFAVTGRIARTMAHEIRNPLTNVNLAVEHLKSEITDNEDATMLFEMIMRNTERINQLISNLLNSTRTAELNFVEASINDVLDRSLEFAQDRIELKQIRIIKNYDADICPISVNKEKIYIAFLNIIVNAIEAMDSGGTLILSTENKNSRCVARITDNGKGMSKVDVERLFEPYFTTKENGHGLGLTNTQNIILSHKASITAESKPGVGTTFIVTFDFA